MFNRAIEVYLSQIPAVSMFYLPQESLAQLIDQEQMQLASVQRSRGATGSRQRIRAAWFIPIDMGMGVHRRQCLVGLAGLREYGSPRGFCIFGYRDVARDGAEGCWSRFPTPPVVNLQEAM
jgi:hypothetical protein